jgi:hypothetical protein
VGAAGFAAGAAFVAAQLLLPFRHLLIPGNVHWTEEGHRWSWHMKLRDKEVEYARFVVDPPGPDNAYEVDPRDVLEPHQWSKVVQRPEMTVLFAHWLAARAGPPGEVGVYVRALISLNQRPAQPMIDPRQDLAKVRVPWWPPAPWILPLEEEESPTRAVRTEPPTGPPE